MQISTKRTTENQAKSRKLKTATLGLIVAAAFCYSAQAADDAAFPAPPPGLAGDSSHQSQDKHYQTDVVEITFQAGERLEYGLHVEQGDLLLYSWKTEGGKLYTDFHGAPKNKDDYAENYWIRYEEKEDNKANGSLTAPLSGHAAWYWVNRTESEVKLHLEVAGYFSEGKIVFRKIGK